MLVGMWLTALPAAAFGVLDVLAPLRLDALGRHRARAGRDLLRGRRARGDHRPGAGRLADRRGAVPVARVGLAIGAVALVVLQVPGSAWSLAIVVVFGAGLLGVLWVPAGLLLTAGAELIDLDHAYAYAFFNLAWAGGFTVGAAGGGALAQVSTDAVPYLLLAAAYAVSLALATVARDRRRPPLAAWVPHAICALTRPCATGTLATVSRVAPALIADLELDLEVFSGPFDLLLTLVLREEVDLLEVELADVVLSYLDFLEGRGELDLEAATEFLLLIAALLELKSRLMLPREEDELLDLEPGEAAEELLARMLEARRYRRAAEYLANRLADEDGHRFRAAPLPPALRRVTYDGARRRLRPRAARRRHRRAAAPAAAGQPRPPHRAARHRGRAPHAPALAAAPRRVLVRRGGARAPIASPSP